MKLGKRELSCPGGALIARFVTGTICQGAYMSMLLFDSPVFSLFHNQEYGWLHVEWRGAHTQCSVEKYCGVLLEAARATNSRKVLSDSSEVLDGWTQTTQWLGQDFLPRLAREGVTTVAILNAMDWPARLCLEAMLRHTRQPTVQLFEFDEMTAAQQWLTAT